MSWYIGNDRKKTNLSQCQYTGTEKESKREKEKVEFLTQTQLINLRNAMYLLITKKPLTSNQNEFENKI